MKLKNVIRRALFRFFGLFPLNNRKIFFDNFLGRGYGCNPKYIARTLKSMDPSLDCVWLSRKDFLNCNREGGRNVRLGFIRAIYEQATAKVWVANNRQKEYVCKRKNQIYLQTWHGAIGIKKCEGDMGDLIDANWKRSAINDSKMIDLMISNSQFCTQVYKRAFWYKGPIWEVGCPRNDLMLASLSVKEKVSEKVRKYFHYKQGTKLFLYAPTFRKIRNDWRFDSLDLEKILDALQKRFGGTWACLLRLHPFAIQANESRISFSDRILNASQYEDMQELMCASDALCTDYSSCIFDFVLSYKPAFMFAPDMRHYLQERSFHFDPYQLPFTCSLNNEEFLKNIENFNAEKYVSAVNDFCKAEGVIEKGDASQRIAELILSICRTGKLDIQKYADEIVL